MSMGSAALHVPTRRCSLPGGCYSAGTPPPGATGARRHWSSGVEEALQAPQQLLHRCLTDALAPPRRDLFGDRMHDVIGGPTALGAAYQDGPPVERIRETLDITVIHQMVDEVYDRGLGNLRQFGKFGDAAARRSQVLEDRQMGSAQVTKPRILQSFQHAPRELLIGLGQQQRKVVRTGIARCRFGSRHIWQNIVLFT